MSRIMQCANCGKDVEVVESSGDHCLEVLCSRECVNLYNAKLDTEELDAEEEK